MVFKTHPTVDDVPPKLELSTNLAAANNNYENNNNENKVIICSKAEVTREKVKREIVRLEKLTTNNNLPKRYHYHSSEINKHTAGVSTIAIFAPQIRLDPHADGFLLHYSEERSPLLLSGGAESIDNVDATPSLKVWDLYTMKLRGEFNQHRIQNKEIITIDAKPSSSQSTKAKVSTIATHQWFPYAVSGDDYGTIILWNPHTCKDVVVHRAPVEKKTISSICIIVNKDLIDRDISPTITKYGQSPVKITSETLFAATGNRKYSNNDIKSADAPPDSDANRKQLPQPSKVSSKWYESLKVVTGSWDKTIRFWDWQTSSQPKILYGHKKSVTTVVSHTLHNDGRVMSVLISGSLDKTCIIWDLERLETIGILAGHQDKITTVRVVDQGKQSPPLVITSSDDKTVIIWDLLTGRSLRRFIHNSKVQALEFFRLEAGLMAVTGEMSGQVNVWNLLRTERLHKCKTADVITIDTYCPPQRQLIDWGNITLQEQNGSYSKLSNTSKPMMVVGSIDGKCRGFEIESGKELGALQLANAEDRINTAVIYKPPLNSKHGDSPLLITGDGQGKLTVWSMFSGIKLAILVGHQMKAILTIGLYDPQQRHEKSPIPIFGNMNPLVIVGGVDKGLYLWDFLPLALSDKLEEPLDQPNALKQWHGEKVTSIKPLHIKQAAHVDNIRSIAVYHGWNKPMLVTGSYDATAILWDLSTMTKTRIFRNTHVGIVFAVAIYDPIAHCGSKGNLQLGEDCETDPLLVTGGYDGCLAVYNLIKGGEVDSNTNAQQSPRKLPVSTTIPYLRKFQAHEDSVTALAVYTPKSANEDPLIVSGSIDTMVIVWNMLTGEKLQTLIGHGNRVCSIYVMSVPTDTDTTGNCDQPYVISGGDDQSIIVWEDALHQVKFMPTRDAVYRAFLADLSYVAPPTSNDIMEDPKSKQPHKDWPLITDLVQTYKHQVFTENSYLFSLAIAEQRPDFLLKFHRYLTYIIRFLPELLKEAISQYDMISVRAVLLSWLHCCNRDIKNRVEQSLFHASYILPTEHLKELAAKFPVEFVMFISGLKLVRNHGSLINDNNMHNKQKLHLVDRLEVIGMMDPSLAYDRTWSNVFDNRPLWYGAWLEVYEVLLYERCSNPQTVTSLMVPLKTAASIEMLGLYVEVSNLLKNVDIFASPIGMIALRYYWQSHGKRLHLLAMVKYLACLLIFMFCIYSYQFQFKREHVRTMGDAIRINAFNVVMIWIFAYYFYEEIEQCRSKYQAVRVKLRSRLFVTQSIDKSGHDMYESDEELGLSKYVRVGAFILSHFIFDIWNFCDIVISFTGITGLVVSIIYADESPAGRILLCITSVAMWFKVLYFMRPFSTSGPLVAMIVQIAYSIRYFLIALFCVLAGFAQGFWLFSNMDSTSDFGTMKKSLWAAFMTMLGAMLPQFEDNHNASPEFASFLLVIFMMVMIILMLNILIALMGDTFSRVRGSGLLFGEENKLPSVSKRSILPEETTRVIL